MKGELLLEQTSIIQFPRKKQLHYYFWLFIK